MARSRYTEVEYVTMQNISINLRSLLNKKGLSQTDLSQMSGLSTSTISDYVNAKTLLSLTNLQKIAVALEVNPLDIRPSEESDDRKSLGTTIKAARDAKGLTLRDLEDITQITFSYIGALERGKYVPSQDKIIALAKALELDQDKLLIEAGYAPGNVISLMESLDLTRITVLGVLEPCNSVNVHTNSSTMGLKQIS